MPTILGLVGHKRAGKDTLADLIGEISPINRYGVADPLKKVVKQLFGFTDKEMEDKETIVERLGISPRQALQKIGTDVVRKQFPTLFPALKPKNIWLFHMEERMKPYEELKDNDSIFVVTDVRFSDEADIIRKHGGKLIRIHRDKADSNIDKHQSEQGVDLIEVDYHVYNNGSIDDLRVIVRESLNKWRSS